MLHLFKQNSKKSIRFSIFTAKYAKLTFMPFLAQRYFTNKDKSFYTMLKHDQINDPEILNYTKSLQTEVHQIYKKAKYANKKSALFSFLRIIPQSLFLVGIFYFLSVFLGDPMSKRDQILDGNFSNYEEIPPRIEDNISDEEFCKNPKRVDFFSVCGNEEAKEQLKDIVEFLKNPQKFAKLNAKMPKGILLSGPPGCGKTLMARALAGEANVTFFSASGSSFEEMFVGVGSARVRKLFNEARTKAPCIIFIDELDSIGEKRNKSSMSRMSLNQILSEIDGFNGSEGIIVIGATNKPKKLDPALIRSGRFDRFVEVQLPDKQAREELLRLNMKEKPQKKHIDLSDLASQTTGFSGADIANMVNCAAIEAIKAKKRKIDFDLLRDAISRISLGKVRTSVHLSSNIKLNTAVHEAGHAVTALFTLGANVVNQLTILPRGSSLGSTWMTPREGTQYSQTKEEILGAIDVAMGGHAAEELYFGKDGVTTGASSDFRQATQLAIGLVAQYGMGESVGKFSADPEDFYKWSPFLKQKVLDEARKIIDESYKRVFRLIGEKKTMIDCLVDGVMRKDTLSQLEIYRIAGIEQEDVLVAKNFTTETKSE